MYKPTLIPLLARFALFTLIVVIPQAEPVLSATYSGEVSSAYFFPPSSWCWPFDLKGEIYNPPGLTYCSGQASSDDLVVAIPTKIFYVGGYCDRVHSPLIPNMTLLDAFAANSDKTCYCWCRVRPDNVRKDRWPMPWLWLGRPWWVA